MVSVSILILLLCSGICMYVSHADGAYAHGGKSAWYWHREAMAKNDHQAKNKDRIPGVCWVCKKVVGKLKDSFGETNITKEEIEEKLKGICDKLWALKKRCHKFVEERKEKLTNIFLKIRDPLQACIAMKLCKRKYPRISEDMGKFISY